MANVARCACTFQNSEEALAFSVVTFHVKKPDADEPWSEAELDLLRARVFAWWTEGGAEGGHDWEEVRSAWPTRFRLISIASKPVLPFGDDPYEFTLDEEDQAGTSGLRRMYPPQLAVCVTLRTSVESRSTRGRIYWPAWIPTDEALVVEEGIVSEEVRDDYAGYTAHLAEHVRGTINEPETDWALCVYSRKNESSLAVTHFAVGDRLATQRRRRVTPTLYTYGLSGDPE